MSGVQELLAKDLSSSGLAPEDMLARVLDNAERAATQSPASINGFVIPYFSIWGKPLPFYRVKLFDHDPKYKQPKDSPNHIYFPRNFLQAQKGKGYVIITEGEKKATLTCKSGIPCVGLGGVDSWRNRIVTMPAETALSTNRGKIQAKFTNGGGPQQDYDAPVAMGFQELLDHVLQNDLNVIIVFDTDKDIGVKADVQRAAATLGYELRFRGVPFNRIRQLILPHVTTQIDQSDKTGIDDFIMGRPLSDLQNLIAGVLAARSAFPIHPSIRDYINKRLQSPKLGRKEIQNVSLAVLSDLDSRGIRLKAPAGSTYYFDFHSKRLMASTFAVGPQDVQFDAPFAQHLYQRYGLSAADGRLMVWLGTQFSAEAPVADVSPYQVFARDDNVRDSVVLQISDSNFVQVNKDGLFLHDNGANNILFEADQVKPLDNKALLDSFKSQAIQPLRNQWADVLSEVRLRDQSQQRIITSLLYYMSPWLHRWRGMQLPVEIITGESGSGKSTLCELRLDIITGRPILRNAPHDLKDWHASVTSTGGLHVTDNVQLVDKSIRQRLSDEIAQPLDVLVLTTRGYRLMGEVHPGDSVIDPWGRRLEVIQEHPHGEKLVYQIELSDGSTTEAVGDHLWFVQNRDHFAYGHLERGKVLTTEQILNAGLTYNGKIQRAKWWIPNVKGDIDLTRDDLNYKALKTISPYVLGVLLGDGNLSSKQVSFFSTDTDIVERVREELPIGVTLGSSQQGNYYLREAKGFWSIVESLKLRGSLSYTKFIPTEYLYSTVNNRLQILRGLMDTDGTICGSGTAEFSSISIELAYGVRTLTQSLGGRSSLSQRLDGAYQVTVNLPNGLCPFFCERKRLKYDQYRHALGNHVRSIVSIKQIGLKEVKCITVNSPEGLYITDDFIITHNCRIITEPNPCIEQRKYYTNADLIRLPVRAVFAITAIQQPFQNADLLQRALMLDFDKSKSGMVTTYNSEWKNQQLKKFGGREAWVAHHLLALNKFFALVEKKWDPRYSAKHRLIHFEQALCLMAEVFGIDSTWIPSYLNTVAERAVSENDWTLEGIKAFSDTIKVGEKCNAGEIASWAMSQDEFLNCEMLVNTRRLGRYMQQHKSLVMQITGLTESGMYANRQIYKRVGLPKK